MEKHLDERAPERQLQPPPDCVDEPDSFYVGAGGYRPPDRGCDDRDRRSG